MKQKNKNKIITVFSRNQINKIHLKSFVSQEKNGQEEKDFIYKHCRNIKWTKYLDVEYICMQTIKTSANEFGIQY